MDRRAEKPSGLHVLLLLLLMLVFTCDGELSSKDFPGLETCGKPYKQDDTTKVKSGSPATLGAYPWMASLGYSKSAKGGKVIWKNAGSLITDRYVITAAHCVHPDTTRTDIINLGYVTKVRLGELDLNSTIVDNATPMNFVVEKITYHNSYSNVSNDNDIALIKLKFKVKFTEFIRPICLPPVEFQRKSFVDYRPTIADWGKYTKSSTGENNTRMLQAEVQIKDTISCRTTIIAIPRLRYSIIDDRVVCASSTDTDACQGDSGGPLMLRTNIKRSGSDSFGNYFLMGIVSYGNKCELESFPGVYTRVSKYMDWIIKVMDNNI